MNHLNLNPISEKRRWSSGFLEGGKGWEYETSLTLPFEGQVIGIDPGVNFAITSIDDGKIRICHGKLKTQTNRAEYALSAMNFTRLFIELNYMEQAVFVLEGAAFNKVFGQVNLAEVRTGFYLGLREYGDVVVPAPMTVRKNVFGDGRIQPMNIWPEMNHNAADSLSIALYGI